MDGFSTRAVHADREIADGSDVGVPIRVSTTFTEGAQWRYRRTSHPTTERLEAVLGSLDGGSAVCYSSGMAAAASLLDVVQPMRVAIPDDVYHGVRQLVERRATDGHLSIAPPDDLQAGDVWWLESPSNPKCQITDLVAISAMAQPRGVITVCDATFATPALIQPLALGIDIVMHSTTKAISGHSDALGGVLVSDDPTRADDLRDMRKLTGAVPGSLDVWLSLRGVRTLELRVLKASESALEIAQSLHVGGVPTWYPGLEGAQGHAIAKEQMRAFGSMLSIDLGDAATAARFVESLDVFTNATSLGGVESLAEHRILSDPDMDPGLVRLSIGIEDVGDLIADLSRALASTGAIYGADGRQSGTS
jgi:cystathionine beta-lyase/cystathionine gamma-synthase